MKKRGLSGIVAAVLLIALVMVAGVTVWVFVRNMINTNLDQASSCFGNFEKITINGGYTCYNSSSSEMQFSINIGDVEIDSLLVSIEYEGQTKTKEITNQGSVIEGLYPYRGVAGDVVSLPGKEEGKTYILTGIGSEPDSIRILPKINEKTCQVSDQILDISNCQAFI